MARPVTNTDDVVTNARRDQADTVRISRRALSKLLNYAQSQDELLDAHFAVVEAREAMGVDRG